MIPQILRGSAVFAAICMVAVIMFWSMSFLFPTATIEEHADREVEQCLSQANPATAPATPVKPPGDDADPIDMPAPAKDPEPVLTPPRPVTEKQPDYSGYGSMAVRNPDTGRQDSLATHKLRIRTIIKGPVARTEIEQTFFNHLPRQTEGTFYFQIPAGANISRLAMFVEDYLMEGEVVERMKARKVYEGIVSRLRDPALMEWQTSTLFKTRIFPIPGRGYKRIIVAYSQILPRHDGERRYRMPRFGNGKQGTPIKVFEHEISVRGCKPEKLSLRPTSPAWESRDLGSDTQFCLKADDYTPGSDYELAIQSGPLAKPVLMCHGRRDEDGFFLLLYPSPSAADSPRDRDARDIIVLFDSSLSQGRETYAGQIKAAQTIIKNLDPADRLALIPFDFEACALTDSFWHSPDRGPELIKALQKRVPMGATNISRAFAFLEKQLKEHPADNPLEILYIGNGMPTQGKTFKEDLEIQIKTTVMPLQARLHVLLLGDGIQGLPFEELCRQTAGTFQHCQPGQDPEPKILRILETISIPERIRPEAVLDDLDTYDVFDVFHEGMAFSDEHILTGRFRKGGNLGIHLPNGKSFYLRAWPHSHNAFIPRVWARAKMAQMLRRGDAVKPDEIIRLSRTYSIMSPFTSFLVLEKEADYAKYGIKRVARRPYWEPYGPFVSAPPPPPLKPARPSQTFTRNPDAFTTPVQGPIKLEDVDLSALTGGNGDQEARMTASGLAVLSLSCYYRHLPVGLMRSEAPSGPAPQLAAELPDFAITIPMGQKSMDLQDISTAAFSPPRPPTAYVHHAKIDPSSYTAADIMDQPVISEADIFPGKDYDPERFLSAFGRRQITRAGGSARSESIVSSGLRGITAWLKAGRFGPSSFEPVCLSVLSYLGAGHTHRAGQYRRQVLAGLDWLIGLQNDEGRIGPGIYEHALATIVLSEAYGMTRDKNIRKHARQALDFLLASQLELEGYWHDPGGASDQLTTAWAVLALKSAKSAGLGWKGLPFTRAQEYFQTVTDENGFAGTDGPPRNNRIHLLHTACILASRILMGADIREDFITKPATLLIKTMPTLKIAPPDELYTRYFATIGIFQMGSHFWRQWNRGNRNALLEHWGTNGRNAGLWAGDNARLGRTIPYPSTAEAARAIHAALESSREALDTKKSLRQLAEALAVTRDPDLLARTVEQAHTISPSAEALALIRLGRQLRSAGRNTQARESFCRAYSLADRAENVLQLYIGSLVNNQRQEQALQFLIKELENGWVSDGRKHMTAALCSQVYPSTGQSVSFMAGQLSFDRNLAHEIMHLTARYAVSNENAVFGIQIYEYLCTQATSPDIYMPDYIKLLIQVRQFKKAFDTLVLRINKTQAIELWQQRTLTELIFELHKIRSLNFVLAEFNRLPASIQPAVAGHAARAAEYRHMPGIAARLYKKAYESSGHRERYAAGYFRQIRMLGLDREAENALIRDARESGRMTAWRIRMLADLVYDSGMRGRAVSEQADRIFPGTRRAAQLLKLQLGNLSREAGDFEAAYIMYRELFNSWKRPVQLVRPFIEAMLETERESEALAHITAAIHAGYSTEWIFKSLAEAGDHENMPASEQLRAASSLIEIDPRQSKHHVFMTDVYIRTGRLQTALEEIKALRGRGHSERIVIQKQMELTYKLGLKDELNSLLQQYRSRNWMRKWVPEDPGLLASIRPITSAEETRPVKRPPNPPPVQKLEIDIVWDIQSSDMDLRVIEPDGTECFYHEPVTPAGGKLTLYDHDTIRKETYIVTRPASGIYRIDIRCSRGERVSIVKATAYTDRGTPHARKREFTVSLQKQHERKTAGIVVIP